MNKVILVGRITKDPELRSIQSGSSVVNFTIAVNRPVAQTKIKMLVLQILLTV